MNLSDLFKTEEGFQLEKRTLTFSNLEQGGAIVTITWKINDLKICKSKRS